MSRLGRSQPVQPIALHGFVDSGVGVPGTAPPAPVVVDRVDQRARYLPLPPIVVNGLLSTVAPPAADTPPAPVVTPLDERSRRRQTPDAIVLGGNAVPVAPPATVSPPLPVIVPVDERARRPPAPPPFVSQTRDDSVPPPPAVVEPARPRDRYRTPDPTVLTGPLAFDQPVTVTPPGPYVVPIEQRRRLLEAITVQHGFVDSDVGVPGTAPPPPTILDRVDQRVRYLPLPSLVSVSGTYAATVPVVVTAPASGAFQDIVPVVAGW